MPTTSSAVKALGRKIAVIALVAGSLPALAQAAPLLQPLPTVSAPYIVAGGPGNQLAPAVAGNLLVFSNCRSGPCTIWGADLPGGAPYQLTNSTADQHQPSTDGTHVIWSDGRGAGSAELIDKQGNFDIYGAQINRGSPSRLGSEIRVAAAANRQSRPRVAGNIVVWDDAREARNADDPDAGDIYAFNISTGKETRISGAPSAQRRPVTNGKVIAWVDYRNERDPSGYNSDIYAYDLTTGQELVISNAPDQQYDVAIAGNLVVWADWRKGDEYDADLYGYDLTTKREFLISGAPGSQANPAVSGDLIVWEDYRSDPQGTNSDIYGFNMATKQEFPIFVGPGTQGGPAATGNLAIWEDASKGEADYDIMAATVSGFPTVVPSGAIQPPVALPGEGSRAFPETGKVVTGLFLDYWQRNGGLPQQGYPISDVIGEVSDLNGQPYTVQYFERAVFEYHPENPLPYNVLLSQLGTFQYKRKYGDTGAPNQKPNATAGSMLFPETGKRVGGKFLQYWKANGGLAQQGFPISEEFQEKSDLNGQTYTVQYFERAVFEMHPENQPPFDVLLSQLGTFQLRQKYGGR